MANIIKTLPGKKKKKVGKAFATTQSNKGDCSRRSEKASPVYWFVPSLGK